MRFVTTHLARTGFASLLGLFALTSSAQTRQQVGVAIGTPYYANIWAVGQGVVMSSTVGACCTFGSVFPTGTVQFYANGQPVGQPVILTSIPNSTSQEVSSTVATIPFQTAGSYTLTASYSGDANFAPAVTSYAWPIQVESSPPTLLPTFSPTSLTFKAGATTGNSVTVTLTAMNGSHGAAQYSTTIAPVPGIPTPAIPATMTQIFEPADANGNTVYEVVIASTAATTIARNKMPASRSKQAPLISAVVLLPLFPFAFRKRLPVLLSAIMGVLFLSGLCGCGSMAVQTATETIPGSAGQYTITVAGQTTQDIDGNVTYYSTQIPVTIQ